MNFACLPEPMMLASPNDSLRKFKQKAIFFSLPFFFFWLLLFVFFRNFLGKSQQMYMQASVLASKPMLIGRMRGLGLHLIVTSAECPGP